MVERDVCNCVHAQKKKYSLIKKLLPYLGVGISLSSAGGSISSRTRSRKYLHQEDSQDLGNQVSAAKMELHIICLLLRLVYSAMFLVHGLGVLNIKS